MQTSVKKLLEALRSGQPISGDEGAKLLAPSYKQTIAPMIKYIEKARQSPERIKKPFLVTGRPGNGKTQTIRQLLHLLRQQDGAAKFAYVYIDLDQQPAARKLETLIPTIVRSTLSSGIVDNVKTVRDRIITGTPVPESAEESLAFSVDLLSGLAGIPAISLFLGFGIKRLLSFLRTRENFISSVLKKEWDSQMEFLELLTAWVRYTLKPNQERDEEFNAVLRKYASRGLLLNFFCFALEKANYSTLVLILDEVDMVTVESLKPIWDPPYSVTEQKVYETNIVFILSVQDGVIAEIQKDEALKRRFCETPSDIVSLKGPNIKEFGEDDLQHIISCVDKLLDDAPQLRDFEANPTELIGTLRDKYSNNAPTYQDIWRDVIAKLSDL